MKKVIYAGAFLLMSGSFNANAQGILGRIKNKVNQRANDKVDNAIDKGLDKTEEAAKGDKSSDSGTTPENQPSDSPSTPSSDNTDNNVASASTSEQPTIKAYQNYDFVPGDKIIFSDNFAEDMDGEFPSHWSIIKGQGTVNKSGDKTVFNILNGNFAVMKPRLKTENYLGDAFTIEFDLFTANGSDCGYGANVFFADKEEPDGSKYINIGRYKSSSTGYFPHDLEGVPLKQSDEDFWNHWHHIAIAYKKPQMKIYIDQNRVLVLPEIEFEPLAVRFGGLAGDESCPISITNVRIASGGNMNMIGKKFTESKIVTHGINFDVDKATLKPESMGTLNMIVRVLKDNPDIKFEIDGHTDNTGTASHNLTLSQERADAVKTQLVSMGIDASRLSTKGLGDTKPISDNTSPEGKANNRRVEFIKM